MQLCIPTEDDTGLTGRISAHFGSARWFTLVDTESGTARSVANRDFGHRPGTCDGAESISGLGVEAVVCSGFGRRAFRSMRSAGIPVYLTRSSTVREAVAEFNMDLLPLLIEEEACSGGRGLGRHHGHGQ
ncbi:MAG: NifB/NifX family molybdenum-iron cluster-binding protein [Candidatus Palauibacterales bacterium]|nr:NifB/NifX family molybdenum-iron cluster-binding protein [Candidatus Palauibacterales bacterium]MDP2483051.1 NifB/NifX family molybdenum-iron cluster-binding protein [Candidatus Palauibacterales bacterium]